MTGHGIILFLFGGKTYTRECRMNVRAIRRFTELPITVFTNPERVNVFTHEDNQGDIIHVKLGDQTINPQRSLQVVESPELFGFKNQTHYVNHTPYDYTVALDCDAVPIHATAFEPFAMLKKFDLCAAHAAARSFKRYIGGVPVCYPQFNCGVLFYRRTLLPYLAHWDKFFRPNRARNNPQHHFARIIYNNTNIRVATLPPEWNWRGQPAYGQPGDTRIAHHHKVPLLLKRNGELDFTRFREFFVRVRKGNL